MGIALLFFVGFILYVYIGYPLLVTLLAQFRPKSRFVDPESWPEITMLIAAYNETAVIAEKIKNSLSLDYPAEKFHLMIAADGSSDDTEKIVQQFADQGVLLSYQPERRGKMAAINRAMPQTLGEIVVFSDANNMYAEDALKALVRPFTNPQVGATTGAKHILKGDGALGESEGLYWKYESFIKKQETRLGSCTAVAGEIVALRRSLFTPPPDRIINDDFYMGMQVVKDGYRLVYTPDARSLEPVSMSAKDEVGRRARIIAGRYQAIALAHQLLPLRNLLVVWQAISHKFMRPLLPIAMLGALLTNLWLMVSSWVNSTPQPVWVQLLFWGQVLFYGTAVIGSMLGKSSRLGKLLYVPTFLVHSNYASLIGLYRFLAGKQSTLWQRAPRRLSQPYK